jgi:hypothetical protein
MKKDDLARLHWIRQQREAKALRAVTQRHGVLVHAQQAADEASAATADHAARAQEHERQVLRALVGKELRRYDILNLQSSLDAAADEQRKLKTAEHEAGKERDAKRAELEEARGVFHHRRREADKLGQIVETRGAALARRQMALTEANDDELHLRPASGPAHPLATSRSEDA